MPRRPAGAGSRAAAALKGRANNQPSCYVGGMASTGVGMMSAGHYQVPEHIKQKVAAGATVEDIAVTSTYFKDLAVGSGTDGDGPADTVSLLDNFLQNRGPSFGPDYAPKNRSTSNGGASVFGVGRLTPSLLKGSRTADNASVYRGVSRARAAASSAARAASVPENTEEDDEEAESDGNSEYGYSDEEDFEEEDEPFAAADSSIATDKQEQDSMQQTEEEKSTLLAQAFAYVSKLERNMARESNEDSKGGKRRRKKPGKPKAKSGKKTRKSQGKFQGNARARSNSGERRRTKNAGVGAGNARSGAITYNHSKYGSTHQKQSRLYGGPKPSSKKRIDNQNSSNAYEDVATASTTDTGGSSTAPDMPANSHILSPRAPQSDAPSTLKFQRPPRAIKKPARNPKTDAKDFVPVDKSSGENASSASNTSRGSRRAFVAQSKREKLSRPKIPQSTSSATTSSSAVLNPSRESSSSTTRKRKGELSNDEIKMLVESLKNGTTASRLRLELEEANANAQKSQSAFEAARSEFASLL